MIDAKRYLDSKPNGLVAIVAGENNEAYLRYKRFDVRDGSESEPEFQKIDIPEILERKNLLEKELKGIYELFNDLHTPTEQTVESFT